MELKGFPLYSSANSAAAAGLRNFITTMERLGAKSLSKEHNSSCQIVSLNRGHQGLPDDT